MMRQAGWVALGLVGGFLIGGLSPRMEAAALRQEQAAMADALAEAQRNAIGGRRGSALPVPGMSEMFEDSRPEPEPRPRPRRPEVTAPPGDDTAPPEPVVIDTGDFIAPEPRDRIADYNLAVDAQRARARQSRAALQEQADLSDDEMEAFDLMVEDMNAALAGYGEDLMALALSGAEPEAEDMLALTHEVTGILYDTQTQINDLVGADAMAEMDPSSRQAWNHVDLEVFRGVVEEMEQ